MDEKKREKIEYEKYLMRCLFSHIDYFTEEKILSFNEFKKRYLQKNTDGVKSS